LDVVSGGELAVALAGGMPASRLNYHGNNKTEAELNHALQNKVARITVDSFYELELLNRLAKQHDMKQKIILRLSPSVDPHTYVWVCVC
jgi:diaminopimelate decarboxylase